MEYLPNNIYFDPFFDCPAAQDLISQEHESPTKKMLQFQFEEFLTSLVLCHHAVSNQKASQREESHSTKSYYKSLYKDEESQLQFADSFGYQFMSRRNRLMTILKRGVYARFDEVIIRKINYGNEKLTIQAVKHFQFNSGVTIYFKGRLNILKDFLPKEIMKICQVDIDKFTQQGIHVFGIGKYEMDSDSANDFIRCVSENQSAYKGTKQNKNDRLLM